MTRWLQSFDFRKSPYERPNQTWVCGRAAEGCPCRVGPDRHGRCRATAECQPRRDGERWVCCRSRAAGGPCAEGPRPDGTCAHPIPPCTPVRSHRARRGRAARWAAALAVGLLAIVLGGSQVQDWLSPGPLSSPHASVQQCASCHTAAEDGPLPWVHAALAGLPAVGSADDDSNRCLTCHTPGERPLAAHGLPAERLQTMAPETAEITGGGLRYATLRFADELLGRSTVARGDSVACATCHREHQGTGADLQAMGDQQCQACHTRKFAGFDDGHPSFDAYPYDRRTRLNFDHVSHIRRHFPESGVSDRPGECADCHQPDAQGAQMRTVGFAEGCAACHAGDVRGTASAGSAAIPVIVVPGLDVPTLRDREAGIGSWPELADRELTPFMRALFAGDAELRDALATYRELDPLDLRDASAEEITAVRKVAWATKALLFDLIADGPQTLQARLQNGLGVDIDATRIRALTAGLPLATLRESADKWFPRLAKEVRQHRAGKAVPIPASEFDSPSQESSLEADDGASGDQQADILGDSTSDTDGDILGGEEPEGGDLPGSSSSGDTLTDDGSQDSILGGAEPEDGDLLGGDADANDQAGGNGERILGGDEPEGGDLLGGDASDGGGDGGDGILGSENGGNEGGGILGGDEAADGDLLAGGEGAAGEETAAAAEPVSSELPQPNPERWSALGGWYRDYFALNYRPGDHADPFLKHWIEVASAAQTRTQSATGTIAAKLGDQLTADGAPGQCAKCHSRDRTPNGALDVNWHSLQPTPGVQQLTRFRHAPHFSRLNDDNGCIACHEFAPEADYEASFADRDPQSFASNFQPIARDTCADCHTASAAGANCTQCHNYHAGPIGREPLKTEMIDMDPAAGLEATD